MDAVGPTVYVFKIFKQYYGNAGEHGWHRKLCVVSTNVSVAVSGSAAAEVENPIG